MRTQRSKVRAGSACSLFAKLATLMLALTFTLSCSGGDDGGSTGGTSPSGGGDGDGNSIQYKGKSYKIVQIDSQIWMAENLNDSVPGSKCGGTDGSLKDENTINCDKYGRLYDWSTAMALPGCNSRSCSSQVQTKHRGICPPDWHIPSNAEWDKLMRYVDGSTGTDSPYDSETAGKYLKAKNGWSDYNGASGNGEDTWGFNALPGGSSRYEEPTFNDLGQRNYWQSASEIDSENAYCRAMSYRNEHAYSYDFPKNRLFSVRCVKDS